MIASPADIVISASDKFQNPTKRVNELWQTDFTYFKIVGWGWYYLATVLDDFSRYIIAWKLFKTMVVVDVKEVLDLAVAETGVDRIKNQPGLLSDNGLCYVSDELRKYREEKGMSHTCGAPYPPQTQGKIERYHRTMKNRGLLQHYYLPQELKAEVAVFVEYYNYERAHESLGNVYPADVFFGKQAEILSVREILKRNTYALRWKWNLRHDKTA